jgi:thymidine kinase
MDIITKNNEMTNINEIGYLELISGPMYSGKTSKLLNLYKQFNFCGIKTLVINHKEDGSRYSDTQLSTHDKIMIPCIMANKLSEIINFSVHADDMLADDMLADDMLADDFKKSQVILINEGQFFQDIVEWVKIAVEKYNKHIYICGLDGDFQRKNFGNWLIDLLPFCDVHTKLHSFCSHCKKKNALFSHRLSNEKEQKIIGSDCYIPLCRLCYKIYN